MRFLLCLFLLLSLLQRPAFCQQKAPPSPSLNQIAAKLNKAILVNGFIAQDFLKKATADDTRTTKRFIRFLDQNGLLAEDHNGYLLVRIGSGCQEAVPGVSLEDARLLSQSVVDHVGPRVQTPSGHGRAAFLLSNLTKTLTRSEQAALEGRGLAVKDLSEATSKHYNALLSYTFLDSLRSECGQFVRITGDQEPLLLVMTSPSPGSPPSLVLRRNRPYMNIPNIPRHIDLPLQSSNILPTNRPITERAAFDENVSSVGEVLTGLNKNQGSNGTNGSDLLVCDEAVRLRPLMLFHGEKMSRDQTFVAVKQLFELTAVQKAGKRVLRSPAAAFARFPGGIVGFQSYLRAITPQPWLDSLPNAKRGKQSLLLLNEYAFQLKRDKVKSLPLRDAPPLVQASVLHFLFHKGLMVVQDSLARTPLYLQHYDECLLRLRKTNVMGMSVGVDVGRYSGTGKWQQYCGYYVRKIE